MKTLIFLFFFSAQIFAEDKIVVTKIPQYLGGGSKVEVKDSSGKTVATGKTIERPKYLGGGSVTTLKTPTGKTVVASQPKPSYLGGGSVLKKK